LIRALTTELPPDVVIYLVREGRDVFVVSDPAALGALDMTERWKLYNQLFAMLDDDPAGSVERRRVEAATAEVLRLDRYRESRTARAV
jgi:hypothetical protein